MEKTDKDTAGRTVRIDRVLPAPIDVVWTIVFETIELFETVVKVFKADEGLQQNAEKPEAYLNQKHSNT